MIKHLLFALFFPLLVSAQRTDSTGEKIQRWEVQAASGMFLDLFYANIFIPPGARVRASTYPGQSKGYTNLGTMTALEVKRKFRKNRSALALGFNHVLYASDYGTGNDSLQVWTHTKRYTEWIQFYGSYYKIYPIAKQQQLQPGVGFIVSGEKAPNPFYLFQNGIADIGASNNVYLWDPGIVLHLQYRYKPCRLLSVGGSFYAYYLNQIGIEGTGIMVTASVNF